MNSSSQLLIECLEPLVRNKDMNNAKDSASIALEIARMFENTNTSLYEGWMAVRDFYRRIEESIEDNLEELYNSVLSFGEETIKAESDAKTAVEKANDSAENILAELGL